MNKTRLLYITDSGFFLSVFNSQVYSYLKNLHPHVDEISLLVLEPFNQRNISNDVKEKKLLEVRNIFNQVDVFKMPPLIGLPSLVYASHKVTKLMERQSPPSLIHARGHIGGYIGLRMKNTLMKNIPFLSDLRGVTRQEIIYSAQNKKSLFFAKLRTLGFKYLEQYIADSSDHVFCVSDKFAEYLYKTNQLNKDKVTVIPTLTDTNTFFYNLNLRNQMRETLSISNRIVFIYSGSLAPWQMSIETIDLFKKILKEIPNAFLLYLTTSPNDVEILFNDIPTENFSINSPLFSEVNSYLNAADIGLLLREKNIVNQVAAPVKIGEYLCSGLPILVSQGIGDLDDNIKQFNLGEIVNENNLKNTVEKLLQFNRIQIEHTGKYLFGYARYIPIILDTYKNIKSRP